ncbi:peptide-methionine (S)-S-oxide reductase [Clostridiaceae bacterium HSG29]|nr:peptide-methionine (S)-S-oxide reductase [Clostridiaceae bacterium HSG29]
MDYFFSIRDSTTLNRQGMNIGSQYRSIIFYSNKNEKESALKLIECFKKSNKYLRDIVTEVAKAGKFYLSEYYHQNYYNNI